MHVYFSLFDCVRSRSRCSRVWRMCGTTNDIVRRTCARTHTHYYVCRRSRCNSRRRAESLASAPRPARWAKRRPTALLEFPRRTLEAIVRVRTRVVLCNRFRCTAPSLAATGWKLFASRKRARGQTFRARIRSSRCKGGVSYGAVRFLGVFYAECRTRACRTVCKRRRCRRF